MKKHETNSFLVSKCFNHQYHRGQTFFGDHINRNHQTYSGDNLLGLVFKGPSLYYVNRFLDFLDPTSA